MPDLLYNNSAGLQKSYFIANFSRINVFKKYIYIFFVEMFISDEYIHITGKLNL